MPSILGFGDDSWPELDHDSKVGLIYSILPGFIEEGFTANASLDIFKDVGLGIGRSEFLSIYRNVLGIEEQQNRVRYVNGNSIPSLEVLADADLPLTDNYRFVYRYSFLDDSTGDIVTNYFGLDRNVLDKVNIMEAEAADYAAEKYLIGRGELISVDIWKGFKVG